MEKKHETEPRFGDDYIPLLLSEEEWTGHEKIVLNRTQRPKKSTRESLLSNNMDYISSTIKGNTHPPTLAILSNSQMDTQMDFVYSEQISTLNSFTGSKASKQVQIVDPLGEKAREGPQSTIKPLPSPIAQVIAATRARQRQRLRPSAGPLPLRETVCVKLGACELSYSASKTSVCQPKQAFNDGLTNDGVCFPLHRQPRRLAASDLIKVDKIQSQGNPQPNPPSWLFQGHCKILSPGWVKST